MAVEVTDYRKGDIIRASKVYLEYFTGSQLKSMRGYRGQIVSIEGSVIKAKTLIPAYECFADAEMLTWNPLFIELDLRVDEYNGEPLYRWLSASDF